MKITNLSKNLGFTLIELVCVIAVLGILAATALPRFINIQIDAKKASIQTMMGVLQTNAHLLHAKCIATDPCNANTPAQSYFLNDGDKTFRMYLGWPDAGDNLNTDEIDVQITYSGFTATNPAYNTHIFKLDKAKDPNTCYVKYVEVASYGLAPTITKDDSGC